MKKYWTKEKRKERSEKTSGENCFWFGKKRSEEDKKKMSLAKKGKHLPKEQIEHIRQSNTGKKHTYKSKETRNVVVNYMKNNNPSKPIRQDLKDLLPQKSPKSPLVGKKLSEETKKKISLSKIGKPLREDVYNNLKQVSELYKKYKSIGGSYTWNEFQFIMKNKPEIIKDYL